MSLKNNRKSVSLNHNELSKSLKSLYDTNTSKIDVHEEKIILLPILNFFLPVAYNFLSRLKKGCSSFLI